MRNSWGVELKGLVLGEHLGMVVHYVTLLYNEYMKDVDGSVQVMEYATLIQKAAL